MTKGKTRIQRLESALSRIKQCVDSQAEDEALWSVPVFGLQPIGEAYLQQELKHLHSVIEEACKELKE